MQLEDSQSGCCVIPCILCFDRYHTELGNQCNLEICVELGLHMSSMPTIRSPFHAVKSYKRDAIVGTIVLRIPRNHYSVLLLAVGTKLLKF